jgi:hypothetical protein
MEPRWNQDARRETDDAFFFLLFFFLFFPKGTVLGPCRGGWSNCFEQKRSRPFTCSHACHGVFLERDRSVEVFRVGRRGPQVRRKGRPCSKEIVSNLVFFENVFFENVFFENVFFENVFFLFFF